MVPAATFDPGPLPALDGLACESSRVLWVRSTSPQSSFTHLMYRFRIKDGAMDDDRDDQDQADVNETDELNAKIQATASERDFLGLNPAFVNSITYGGTLILFLIILDIPSLPRLPFPLNKSLLISNDKSFAESKRMKYLFIAMWVVHFMRRTLEVLLVHIYKRKMPIMECIGAPLYYWFFAVWIAWSLRYDTGYKQSFVELVFLGGLLFFLGELGNCACHIQLRRFRDELTPSSISLTSNHVIPHGFLFNHLSCPHYFCEIVTWIGFFLATWTLSSLAFLVATIITLVVYSQKKHQAYLNEFDGKSGRAKYPSNRRALIPWIF